MTSRAIGVIWYLTRQLYKQTNAWYTSPPLLFTHARTYLQSLWLWYVIPLSTKALMFYSRWWNLQRSTDRDRLEIEERKRERDNQNKRCKGGMGGGEGPRDGRFYDPFDQAWFLIRGWKAAAFKLLRLFDCKNPFFPHFGPLRLIRRGGLLPDDYGMY